MDGSRGRICSGILHLVFIENGEERRSSLGRKIAGNYDNRKGQINHYGLVQHSCCCILAKSRLTLQPQGLRHARLLCPLDFSGKNIEMRCCILLQEIIPTQRLNPRLLGSFISIFTASHRHLTFLILTESLKSQLSQCFGVQEERKKWVFA